MRLKRLFLLVATAAGLLVTQSGRADLSYLVTVNIAPLLAAPLGAPYYVDFQLNGDGLGLPNAVTINNFSITGGALVPGTAQTFGNVNGNLASGFTLTENSASAFNEFYQQFAGGTLLRFMVTSTTNNSGLTPDAFLFSILDKTTGQIATNAPDNVSLLAQMINGTAGLSNMSTYQSTSPAGVTVSISAVPESGPGLALSSLLTLGLLIVSRQSSKLRS